MRDLFIEAAPRALRETGEAALEKKRMESRGSIRAFPSKRCSAPVSASLTAYTPCRGARAAGFS